MKSFTSCLLLAVVAASAAANNNVPRPPTRTFNNPEVRARVDAFDPEKSTTPEQLGNFFEGDMLFGPDMKNGIQGARYRWPGGQIPYYIEPGAFNADQERMLYQAFDDYSRLTGGCVTWVPWNNHVDYVYIWSANSGCYSYVGRQGGSQELNLQVPGCMYYIGTPLHEMFHAAGFFHEQSRHDRDDYVTINWQNIQAGTEYNFDKYEESYATPFGVGYDYGSVMHYDAYAFSANGAPTITPHDPDAVLGQRERLADSDVERLKRMYGCA